MTQPLTLGQAQTAVAALVERFERNLEQYRRPEYNEANVGHEFIEPFFEALGWDVHNRAGYSEAYKDVTFEGSPRVGAGVEAPDYAFRVGGKRVSRPLLISCARGLTFSTRRRIIGIEPRRCVGGRS